MNTRQKLTLGIAAIFMVTLTIVGVTYAYFTTQVDVKAPASADITTATFGDVTFVKDEPSVTLDSMAANEKETLDFSVSSSSKTALKYDLLVTESPGQISFLKSSTDGSTVLDTCIGLGDLEAAPADCYKGKYYDYVTIKITRYTDEERTIPDTLAGTDGVVYEGKLKVTDTDMDYAKGIDIAAATGDGENLQPTVHYYRLEVTHVDATENQNVEQGASVVITPDIDSIA